MNMRIHESKSNLILTLLVSFILLNAFNICEACVFVGDQVQRFPGEGGSGSIRFSIFSLPPNENIWNVDSDADWIIITNKSGSGPGYSTFQVLPNNSSCTRIAFIRFSGELCMTQSSEPIRIIQAPLGQDNCNCTIYFDSAKQLLSYGSDWNSGARTVYEKISGLMWEVKSPLPTEINYIDLRLPPDQYISTLNSSRYGGYSDWRLPSIAELSNSITASSSIHCYLATSDDAHSFIDTGLCIDRSALSEYRLCVVSCMMGNGCVDCGSAFTIAVRDHDKSLIPVPPPPTPSTPPQSINTPPSAPTLLYPDKNALLELDTISFSWNSSTDADGDAITYCLSIYEDGSPKDIPIYLGCDNNIFLSDTTWNMPIILEPSKQYWWAVWAKDANDVWGVASEWRMFRTVNTQPDITIQTNGLPTGQVGKSYIANLQVSGALGQVSWSISRGVLPQGLELNMYTGMITGIPADISTTTISNFAVMVTDSQNRLATKELKITIREPMPRTNNNSAKRYALIIGGIYTYGGPVDRPASEFYQYLKESKEWRFDEVKFLGNSMLNWDVVRTELERMKANLKEGDHFLLYLSGHGGSRGSSEPNYPNPPYGNEESGYNDFTLYKYTGWIRVTGLLIPSITIDVDTKEDEFFQFPSVDSAGSKNIYDDQLTHYFRQDPKWNTINKYFFFDFCQSGGFWGGSDEGDLERLQRIAFAASTPEGYMSKTGNLWNWIKDAVNSNGFNYTFESLFKHLEEQVRPVTQESEGFELASADPEVMANYYFKFLQYPVTFRDALIEDVSTNRPPVAVAGQSRTLTAGSNCLAIVTLDGSQSYDPDNDQLSYNWIYDGGSISGMNPTLQFPLGTWRLTLIVNDGNISSQPAYMDVTVVDRTPPNLSVSVSPNILWPPNHKMVYVKPVFLLSDNCDTNPSISVPVITMNEGATTSTYDPTYDGSIGDGNTTNDIQYDMDGNLFLRAERSALGSGRVYTIRYRATDVSGNSTSSSATVTVPHNQ